jgi:DNA ligase-1
METGRAFALASLPIMPRCHPANWSLCFIVMLLWWLPAVAETGEALGEPEQPAAAPGCRGVSPARVDEVPPLPLANHYGRRIALADYWVSEKLDGVRAYWDGARLISRGGHLIHSPDGFTAGFPGVPLDGELWIGRGRFEQVSGAARQQTPDPADWAGVRFLVFDLPCAEGPFSRRLAALRRLLVPAPSPRIGLVEQTRVADHAALMARLDAVVAAGGEGLMLRRDSALYRAGRSDDLLKVKSYMDSEARVVAHLPGKGKFAGMLGALLVEEPDGRRFRIGTGLSNAERRDPPPVGATITFKYQGRTANGIPRFARFLRLRPPEP